MKILVLGAGATGGYFGGRLAQVGADVAFLVRARRAAQLAANGLVVTSPHGDFARPVKFIQQAELRPEHDLVIVACKAYDLDAAIESIRPALRSGVHVLPLLNGLVHIDRLGAAFGAGAVIGGSCHIASTVSPTGEVEQMTTLHRVTYGLLPHTGAEARAKLEALHSLFKRTPVDALLTADMQLELWEKFVLLAALATMTCLMRANVGEIMATRDGAALMAEALEACRRVAAAAGFPPRDTAMAGATKMLFARGSTFAASMLRDMERGHRIE